MISIIPIRDQDGFLLTHLLRELSFLGFRPASQFLISGFLKFLQHTLFDYRGDLL